MAAPPSAYKVTPPLPIPFPLPSALQPPSPTHAYQFANQDRQFLAVIGDEDSVTGLLLAGIGHITPPPDSSANFFVVDAKTETQEIERWFNTFTRERKDVGILLVNQHIAERIRNSVDAFTEAFPAVLEIPSKDHPYDPEKDSVLRRVRRLFGE
ncbi:H(+)-transporting V1 sector ATPase subunit F [Mycoblastus sanguinarius]|nr:H(+)-transporting V1 sector ATPase subunit F [Mycoblastus sanguinarius]